jgi:hypothetical protein
MRPWSLIPAFAEMTGKSNCEAKQDKSKRKALDLLSQE